MQIQEAILHQITKDVQTQGADSTTVNLRAQSLPIDERLIKTATEIVKAYGKLLSGYGTFDADEEVHQFPSLLRRNIANELSFVEFTSTTTRMIANEMSKVFFANGGYSLFLRYTSQGQDWCLIVMLKLKDGTGLNKTTLELLDAMTFDVDHLREAARIDLSKWQTDTQPYLSFIKKGKSDDVTQYFREALGCTEYTESKHNTKQMKDAVEAFCSEQDWDTAEKRDARQRVYDYCDAKTKSGDPVNLKALSALIDDQQPEAFIDFVRDKNYEISETFKPHRETYIRFKRISRQFGSVRVSFDVQDLLDGRVEYDEETNHLVITNLPDELVTEIQQHKATANGHFAE